jgi:hypothetical protein
MKIIDWLREAITRDPAPSKLLVETVSDRAALVLRCECYKHLLRSHGWTDEHLREAELEYRATVKREVRGAA